MSQKEKDKHCILTHVYGIWKDGADEPICRAVVDTDTEDRLVDIVGDTWREQHGNTHYHTQNRASGDSLLTHGAQPRAL